MHNRQLTHLEGTLTTHEQVHTHSTATAAAQQHPCTQRLHIRSSTQGISGRPSHKLRIESNSPPGKQAHLHSTTQHRATQAHYTGTHRPSSPPLTLSSMHMLLTHRCIFFSTDRSRVCMRAQHQAQMHSTHTKMSTQAQHTGRHTAEAELVTLTRSTHSRQHQPSDCTTSEREDHSSTDGSTSHSAQHQAPR